MQKQNVNTLANNNVVIVALGTIRKVAGSNECYQNLLIPIILHQSILYYPRRRDAIEGGG